MVSPLSEEEPKEDGGKKGDEGDRDFCEERKFGGVEGPSRNDGDDEEIKVAAVKDDFFREVEVFVREGSFCGVVWVSEKFAVNEEFDDHGKDEDGEAEG